MTQDKTGGIARRCAEAAERAELPVFDSLCAFIGLTRTIDLAAFDFVNPPDRATG